MRSLLVTAVLASASIASAANRFEPEIATVRSAQAELRGRPSLSSAVTGLVRRGETVEIVRSSSDRRWVQVEIGGGELAWIEARAVTAGAMAPEPAREQEHTLRVPRASAARPEEDRRFDEPAPRVTREVRADPPPQPPPARRETREPPREVRADPQPQPQPQPQPVAREPAASQRPLRDIPAAAPGELYAADLDDERPPSGPAAVKRTK